MGVVVLSTVVFILSTMPELSDEIDMILFTNTTDASTGQVTQQPVERWEDVSIVFYYFFLLYTVLFADLIIFNFQGILALSIIDHASMVFFTAGEILAWKLNFSCWIYEEPKCSLQILGPLVQMFGWITLIFAREYWKVLNEFSMLAQLPVYDVQCGM